MSTCDEEPLVSNAKAVLVSDNETVKVTYECLAGFYMSGSARLVCNRTANTWETPPTCNVIYQGSNFYNTNNIPSSVEVWWYYIIAGVLGFMALLLLFAVIWCCCCRVNAPAINPDTEDNPGRVFCCRCFCCRPAKVEQARPNDCPKKGRRVQSASTETESCRTSEDNPCFLTNNSQLINDMPIQTTETKSRIAESIKQTAVEIPAKGSLVGNCGPVKDKGRKNKLWMPHTHGVRNNKTSTKRY